MKILQVISGIEQISGGPSQAAVEICHALNKAGVESYLATTRDPLNRYKFVDFESIRNQLLFFERWSNEYLAFSKDLKKWLDLNVKNYDLVHIHSFFNYPSYVAATCARTNGIPYIIRPAGALNAWSMQHQSWKKLLWINFLERQNLKRVSVLHATSKTEADYLSKFIDKSCIEVIPLGVDLPEGENINPRLPEQSLQILFLSRINPKKNLPILLSAIKKVISRHIPVTLRIAGKPDPGRENYEQELRTLVQQMGLGKLVTFLGFVEGDTKIAEFNKSHIFVLPSSDENFGLAVVEAMAHGLPVIISNQVALAEYVLNKNAGLVVDCKDIDGLADAIELVYQDEDLRLKMSQQARCLASHFSWLSTADSLICLYSKILQDNLQ